MADIAPLIFRTICRGMLRGNVAYPAGRRGLDSAPDDADGVRNWLIGEVTRLELPGAKVYTDEPQVSPHLVVRSASEAGGFAYLGIEIRILDTGAHGKAAAEMVLDYGSLPPCGVFKTERPDGKHLFVKGYYLFILLDGTTDPVPRRIRTLVMCDGDFLNDDLGFFLEEERAGKHRNRQGPYGDGSIRKRAGYFFPNPLCTGISELADKVTLIHASEALNDQFTDLIPTHVVKRARLDGSISCFCLYRYGTAAETPPEVSEIELFRELKDREPPIRPRRRFVVRD